VGDAEITQIYDGIWNRPLQDGFVKDAALADVQAALKAAGLAENIVPIPFTITAVTIGGKTTLVDSGTGVPGQVQPTAGLASAKNLAAVGIDPAKIENIVMSHFHPDHISGLMSKDSQAEVFPKATIHVPAPELASRRRSGPGRP
jgi:glyoxylase-like metal-dependent hydrolase (beta-lactamase superfamily II)